MQNAAPDSPRLRPALAGTVLALALALVAAAAPAAAEEVRAPAPGGFPRLLLAEDARHAWPERWSVWPTAVALRLRAGEEIAPVGLAFRLGHGLSLGATGSFDPKSGEAVGLLSFELAF